MAFHHLHGVTTPGAADEVIDWFATFEAWLSGTVGWIVAGGAGTQDIIFRSVGEVGGLALLYIRVWRDGGNPDRVRFEVQNDLAGTQVTTADGYCDTGGVQFEFWMSADLDALVVCFKLAGGYRSCYVGLVEPFALTVPDETYQMVSCSGGAAGSMFFNASILRNAAGLWDQIYQVTDNAYFDDARIDRYDGSFTLHGCYFGSGVNIAGQMKHISGIIEDPAIMAEDEVVTGRTGATTTWKILADAIPNRFALRTGGILPVGVADGTFASANGIAANYPALFAAISALAVGVGWVDLGDPGFPAGVSARKMLYSTGESGLENIYAGFGFRPAVTDEFNVLGWNDVLGTHTILAGPFLDATEFPLNYWVSLDRDCIMLVCQRAGGYVMSWVGMVVPFPPSLIAPYAGGVSLTEYNMICAVQGDVFSAGNIMRDHAGLWSQAVRVYNDGPGMLNSNPNAFDGTTYLVWPMTAHVGVGADFEPIGQCKYWFSTSGGGVANLDTITVGAEVYTVFFDSGGLNFCMRTT